MFLKNAFRHSVDKEIERKGKKMSIPIVIKIQDILKLHKICILGINNRVLQLLSSILFLYNFRQAINNCQML